jgi:hypothetical protein
MSVEQFAASICAGVIGVQVTAIAVVLVMDCFDWIAARLTQEGG